MNELFKDSEIASKSPRLLWMEKHDIHTKERADLHKDEGQWEAWVGDYKEAINKMLDYEDGYPDQSPDLAWGEDEQEALDVLAANMEIELIPNG